MTDVNNRADLSTLKLAELQALAGSLGIAGASKLRKGDLVDAINENQNTTTADSGPVIEEAPDVETRTVEASTEAPVEAPPVAVRKRASRRVTSADTEAIAAAGAGVGAPVVDAPIQVIETPAEAIVPATSADTAEAPAKSAPRSARAHAAQAASGLEDPTPADVAVGEDAAAAGDNAEGDNTDNSEADNADSADNSEGGSTRSSRNRAISARFSRPVRTMSTVTFCPVIEIACRTAAGAVTTSWPATVAVPESGCSSVVRIEIVVVLPAPLVPSSA